VVPLATTLLAIVFVHSGNRVTAALAMGVFAAAVAVAIVMIAAQDRPFAGQLGVNPLCSSRSLRADAKGRARRDAALDAGRVPSG